MDRENGIRELEMADYNTENQGFINIMELFEEYAKLRDSTDIVAKLQYLIRRRQFLSGSAGLDSETFSIRVLREAVETIESLLKAQEAVEPTIGGDADGPCRNWWYQCGKCKEAIDYHDKYCRKCGRAVKWE